MENNIKNLNALLKPFNLEEALKGKPVVTRSGLKVTEIHHFKTISDDEKFTLYAVIQGDIYSYDINGYHMTNKTISDSDLLMEEPIVEGWVNIYYDKITGNMWTSDVHATYEHAISIKDEYEHYIKTIKIDNQ